METSEQACQALARRETGESTRGATHHMCVPGSTLAERDDIAAPRRGIFGPASFCSHVCLQFHESTGGEERNTAAGRAGAASRAAWAYGRGPSPGRGTTGMRVGSAWLLPRCSAGTSFQGRARGCAARAADRPDRYQAVGVTDFHQVAGWSRRACGAPMVTATSRRKLFTATRI
jgi:hypothetical protein